MLRRGNHFRSKVITCLTVSRAWGPQFIVVVEGLVLMVDMVPRDDVTHAAAPARSLDTSSAIVARSWILKKLDVNINN